jgi:uncharacterized protein (UPF0248 family)
MIISWDPRFNFSAYADTPGVRKRRVRIIQVTGQIFFRDNKNIPRHILIGIFEEYDGSVFIPTYHIRSGQ